MPRGELINTRVYWTVPGDLDDKGNPKEYRERPKTGLLGTGLGGSTPVQHREELYDNGDTVVSRLDPGSDRWVQENVLVDPDRQKQYQFEQEKAQQQAQQQAAAARAERSETRAQATETRVARAQERQAAATEAAGRRAEAAAARQERRELTLAEIQADRLKWDKEREAGRISAAEAARRHTEWYQDRLLEHQQATEARAAGREERMAGAQERSLGLQEAREGRLERAGERQMALQEQQHERLLKQQEQNLAFNQQSAALNYGQNRVQDVLSTLPYRVGPGFAGNFAQALGSAGPVHFDPSDFTFRMPNLDQAREEGFRRAMSVFGVNVPPSAVDPLNPGGPLPLPPPYPSMPR